jgi:hypothetical protein
MTQHISWTEIESFHNVRKAVAKYPHIVNGNSSVSYRAKVKIHGTNAGVIIDSFGNVTAESRSCIITPESDNAGFAKWVAERHVEFAAARHPTAERIVIFGEWCGPGIQKGVAANQIPEKIFAVFGIRIIDDETNANFVSDPRELAHFVRNIPGSYVIPWFNDGEIFQIDWAAAPNHLQPVIDRINTHVLAIDDCDPWIDSQFNVKGPGEGLVFYPIDLYHVGYDNFSNLCFKAKGEKHKTIAKDKPAQLDPTIAANMNAFVEMVLTPARLEQGVRATNDGEFKFEQKNIGAFLAWISRDIIKETNQEMNASGLDPKSAVKACSNHARIWFITEMKKL